jgi:hypothetical protein
MKKISKEDWKILSRYGVTPDNLTVGGSLDLRGTSITELPDNLTVGRYLDLRGTSITELPDNLTVGYYLDLEGTSITELPDNLTVGGSLDLRGTSITELPDNLTVGRYLDLRDTSITELPDNLTVGGSLDLRDTSITELPDNLTVGYYLDLEGTSLENIDTSVYIKDTNFLSWQDGKYIKVDGLFTEVVSKRGNVYKVKTLNSHEESYLVADGNGKYSHGETLKMAKEDLIYKLSNDINKDKYKDYTIETVLSFEEAIECYRVITGSCSFGVKSFIESNPNYKREDYTINDIITFTDGQYGSNDFRQYFGL